MIKKIVLIKNVGRFSNCQAGKDVEFGEVTVIHAENACGKTTLSSIFRSLGSGKDSLVKERKTLGSAQSQRIEISTDSGQSIFKKDKWDITYPKIVIFDQNFVTDNVYSGDSVDVDHNRRHYNFIVGEEGVRLAKKVDDLDEKIKTVTAEIKELSSKIKRYIVDKTEVSDFIGIEEVANTKEFIETCVNEIKTLENKDDILEKPCPVKLQKPELPIQKISELLGREIESISRDAEERVKAHLKKYMDSKGEAWINKGLSYVKDTACPFCEQNLEGSEIFPSYKEYFKESYNVLKNEISLLSDEIESLHIDDYLLDLKDDISNNTSLAGFWEPIIKPDFPEFGFDILKMNYKKAERLIKAHIENKAKVPLEKVVLSEDLNSTIQRYKTAIDSIAKYNDAIDEITKAVNIVKTKTKSGDIESKKGKLITLRNTEIRFLPECKKLCDKYALSAIKKIGIEKDKKRAKKALDSFSKAIVARYGKDINVFLEKFGANFRIKEFHTTYKGRKPRTEYKLEINEVSVPLSLSKDETSPVPCFKNTISSGDKSALAFAFFIARLNHDDELAGKTVVFDDPISSMDRFRKTVTCHYMIRIAGRAKQLIVLSHDPFFLKEIWTGYKQTDLKPLEIVVKGKDCIIKKWDIISGTRSTYSKDYQMLVKCLREGYVADKVAVVRCIRPVLEGILRHRFDGILSEKDNLGKYIGEIKKSKEGQGLYCAQGDIEELEELNDFCIRFSHASNGQPGAETPEDGELKSFTQRAINYIKGA